MLKNMYWYSTLEYNTIIIFIIHSRLWQILLIVKRWIKLTEVWCFRHARMPEGAHRDAGSSPSRAHPSSLRRGREPWWRHVHVAPQRVDGAGGRPSDVTASPQRSYLHAHPAGGLRHAPVSGEQRCWRHVSTLCLPDHTVRSVSHTVLENVMLPTCRQTLDELRNPHCTGVQWGFNHQAVSEVFFFWNCLVSFIVF